MKEIEAPYRLCFRSEGQAVACYLALRESMDGAIELARFSKRALELDVDGKLFEDLQAALGSWLQRQFEAVGVRVLHLKVERASEHERSGEG